MALGTAALCSGTLHLLQDLSQPQHEIGGPRKLSSLKFRNERECIHCCTMALCSGTQHPLLAFEIRQLSIQKPYGTKIWCHSVFAGAIILLNYAKWCIIYKYINIVESLCGESIECTRRIQCSVKRNYKMLSILNSLNSKFSRS